MSNRPSLASLFLVPAISTLIFSSLDAQAYIPAVPVNDTAELNLSDASTISITWQQPYGVYSGAVSFQLQADIPTGGTTQGALVHFTESSMGQNATTDTPWIAYVSCDANETQASMEWDIFTLARDRGASSALLYSAYSQSCLLNQDYIQNFEKPLDVFATNTRQIARLIDSQWTHTNQTFYTYNGTLLNESGIAVNESLAGQQLAQRTYLVGTLVASNASGQITPTEIPGPTSAPPSNGSYHAPASMIALYVIVGIVGSLFIVMLLLGWRRARANPERYGRREEGQGQPAQTTAGGLAQAILDTFPVIKFREHGQARQGAKRIAGDDGPDPESIVLPNVRRDPKSPGAPGYRESLAKSFHTSESSSFHSASEHTDDASFKSPGHSRSASRTMLGGGSRQASRSDLQGQPLPEDEEAGQDQCPICLLQFEEGDDLRVLPCEKEHVYHQACIDPWLLQVSGSCPLCRKDFNAPAAASAPSPTAETPSASPTSVTHPPTQGGFARYLAFMRRERRTASRRRANTTTSGRTRDSSDRERSVYSARHGEGEQGGPGGY